MFRGEKNFDDLHAVFTGAGQFPIPLQHGQLLLFTRPPVAELDHMFDRIILRTGDFHEFHRFRLLFYCYLPPYKIARRNRKIQPYPNEYSRIAPTIINVAIPRRSQTSPPLGVSRFRTPILSSSKVSRIASGPRAAMITLPNTGPTIA